MDLDDYVPCHFAGEFIPAGSSTDEEETEPTPCAPETAEHVSSQESELSLPGSLHSDGGSVLWHSEFDACREAYRFSDDEVDSQCSSLLGSESEFSAPCTLDSERESRDSALSANEEAIQECDQSDNGDADKNTAEVDIESNKCLKLESDYLHHVSGLTNLRSDDSDSRHSRKGSAVTDLLNTEVIQRLPSTSLSDSVNNDSNLFPTLDDTGSKILSQKSATNDQFNEQSSLITQSLNVTRVLDTADPCRMAYDSKFSSPSGFESEFSTPCVPDSEREARDSALTSNEEALPENDKSDNAERRNSDKNIDEVNNESDRYKFRAQD